MSEILSIVTSYKKSRDAKRAMGLATVLRVDGSSYRQPGARMLITEEGEIAGSVSGGCLERDLIRKALAAFTALDADRFKTFRFDTTEDGEEYETLRSVSLGCQGVIDISLEIIRGGESHEVLEVLGQSIALEQSITLATTVTPGKTPLFAGSSFFEPPATLDFELRQEIKRDLSRLKKTEVKKYAKVSNEAAPLTLLLEQILPPLRWIIFGASHDSVPLAALGKFMGWHVTVVDCHSAYTMPHRFFNNIDAFTTCASSQIGEKLKLAGAYCAVVTHNYHDDLAILAQLLPLEVSYIGLLGPKKKGNTILADLREKYPDLELKSLARLFSPAGIDAGGDGPQSVALAIVTEALAVNCHRPGGFLKNRAGPIHDRDLS